MYTPSFYLKNKHLQTIIPSLFRKIEGVSFIRERLETPDNDFIDCDWSKVNSDKIVFLFHGLEGHSNTQYIKGLTKVLNKNNFDVVAVNFRSCSGEPNRLLKSYNCGVSDDAKFVINSIIESHSYNNKYAVGFSLGGNVLLKYLGEEGLNSMLDKAVGISVPVDLESSALHLEKGFNRFYLNRFLRRLKEKVKDKERMFPDSMDFDKIYQSTNFREFDDLCTAPVHGYDSAFDYWKKCSSKQFIESINTPTKIINAKNDPFLPKECFPYTESSINSNVELLTPKHGGHVGFPKTVDGMNYYEKEVIDFFNN